MHLTSLEAIEADKIIAPEIVREKWESHATRVSLAKSWKMPLSDLDIIEARLVIGVGNGVDKREFMSKIDKLAELLEGVIGGSRVAVFRGLIPVERQIGSTGKFINADVYIPIGIIRIQPAYLRNKKCETHNTYKYTKRSANIQVRGIGSGERSIRSCSVPYRYD